ncbi:tetratricopeptide repeat protein, partial [Nodularia spumigena]
CKRLLGDNHPDVATSLNNLANLYYSQGRYDEAEPLYLQAFKIRQQVFGVDHPKTVTVRENLDNLRANLSDSPQSGNFDSNHI